jgi:hypothetical protein
MEILDERQQAPNEMATVCSKNDGYGMIIEVYSEDHHGVLGGKSNPAHVHLKTPDNKYLGKFAITRQPPRAVRHVFDCDKNKFIPPEYKGDIVKWAKTKYRRSGSFKLGRSENCMGYFTSVIVSKPISGE